MSTTPTGLTSHSSCFVSCLTFLWVSMTNPFSFNGARPPYEIFGAAVRYQLSIINVIHIISMNPVLLSFRSGDAFSMFRRFSDIYCLCDNTKNYRIIASQRQGCFTKYTRNYSNFTRETVTIKNTLVKLWL